MSSCPACPLPSYLRHPSISSSLVFVPTTKYFIPTHPPTLSLSFSLLYISIYLYIYIYHLTHFLSYISLTHSLSFFHSLLLSSPFSQYLNIYHTHTLSLTLSAFHRVSASPISVIPCNKLDRGPYILPLAPIIFLHKFRWGRLGEGGLCYHPRCCTIPSILTINTIHML